MPAREAPSIADAARLSSADLILVAMYRYSQGRESAIPYEEIVIQAWRDFPSVFGLRNHISEYPDSSDIHKRLYTTLQPKGFIVRLGNKQFRLTEGGIEHARDLESRISGAVAPEKARLHRSERVFIDQALKSEAYEAWVSGDREKLIDYDVQLLLKFGSGTSMTERRERLDQARAATYRAMHLGEPGMDRLLELLDHLAEKFSYLFMEGVRR